MADQSVKTIKERIKLLRDLKKEGKELSAIQEQELRTLRAQKKEYAGLSKWQKDLLNKGDLRLDNEKIAHKYILKQKDAEKDISKWLEKKKKSQDKYKKGEASLNKKLEKLVKDGDAYKRVQAEIVDLQKQGAKEVGGYDKYIELAEQQKSLNVDLGKLQEDQIANQMKAAQGKLEESDIAAQLVQIAGLEKKLKEDSARLSKEEKDQIKAQISYSKSALDKQEDMNDIAKVKLGMESKLDDISGGLIGKYKSMKQMHAMINKVAGGHPYIKLAIVLLGILALGVKLLKQTMELKKEFGLSVGETMKLQGAMIGATAQLYLLGVSAEEVKATAGALIDEFGSVNNVTKDTLVSLGKMHATLGIAGADAVKLLGALEGVSGASRETLMAQMKVTGELAQAAGVAPAKVMKDLADNTETFADFAMDGGENLQAAAIQAAKLGISLSVVSKMANSLLDFESSIANQMEASMMLGRQINTDKARQLALAGDLEGLQKEVMNQIGTEAEFAKMNVLQRRSLAKAFGLSTEELGKMVRDQEKINNMSAEELAAQKKRQELLALMSQTWTTIVTAIKDGLMPVLSVLGTILAPFLAGLKLIAPILGPIVKVLGIIAVVIGIIAIASWAAASPWIWIPLAIMGVVGIVSLLMKKFKSFGEFVKFALEMAFAPLLWYWDMLKKVGSFIGGLFGGGGGDKSKAAAPAGEEAKDFISRPGTGMEKFSPKDTVVGVQDPGALGGGGADMSVTNEKLQEMINEIIALRTSMDTGQKKLTKKVGDIGVAG